MLDPLTLGTLIATSVLTGLTLIVNLFQSFKMDHFKLNCSSCCSIDVDNDHDEKNQCCNKK
jgi:hypothetical protein